MLRILQNSDILSVSVSVSVIMINSTCLKGVIDVRAICRCKSNKGKWKTETIEYRDENEDFKNKFVSSKMTLYKF